VKAEVNNYIVGIMKVKLNKELIVFLLNHPNEKRVFGCLKLKEKVDMLFLFQKMHI
jgi:hypothetical protein